MGEVKKLKDININYAEARIYAKSYNAQSNSSRNINMTSCSCEDICRYLKEQGMREAMFVKIHVEPSFTNDKEIEHGFHLSSYLEECIWDEEKVDKYKAKSLWENYFTEIVSNLITELGIDKTTVVVLFHDTIKTGGVGLMMI
ncbi:hypothetical protein IKF25_02335 [Candidatus Saccharibacteria bacterium]|nr:hypothetical protein [Candidatus Saccharibacteria bacterium]